MYCILIEDKSNGIKVYHKGGDIKKNTPTLNVDECKKFKDLKGAKIALNGILKKIGGSLVATIEEVKE